MTDQKKAKKRGPGAPKKKVKKVQLICRVDPAIKKDLQNFPGSMSRHVEKALVEYLKKNR